MEIALTVIFALLGMAIGSFLNVCIDRIPAGKSLVSPPSHCDICQHPLSPQDLIPVFSYLWLRGRCRYCRARIPLRPLWVELGSAFLLAFSYWHNGLSADFAVTAFYSCIFVVIMVIDWKHRLILNKTALAGGSDWHKRDSHQPSRWCCWLRFSDDTGPYQPQRDGVGRR